MFKIVLFVLSLVCLSSQTAVQDAFKRHQIVPDVIPVAPEKLLKVVFANNLEVNLGTELKPSGWLLLLFGHSNHLDQMGVMIIIAD